MEDLGRLTMELAAEAHEGAPPAQFRARVLQALEQITHGDTGVFSSFEPGEWPFDSINLDAAGRKGVEHCELVHDQYQSDLQKGFVVALRQGGFISTDVYTLDDHMELPLFREICKPQGITCELMLIPSWRNRPLGRIRMSRYGRTGNFTGRHLEHALRLLPVVGLGMFATTTQADRRTNRLDGLSARESEIARYVMRNLTTGEIARLLGTSPLTVRNQLCRIFEKTGASGRTELAVWMAMHSSGL
jgi:DNA-binding CsgD family transcriptional regulator